jgi:hypothetical protein
MVLFRFHEPCGLSLVQPSLKHFREGLMVTRPAGTSALEFAVVSSLRAAQLMRGCTPRIESTHKLITTAQMEVAAGKIVPLPYVASIVDPV